MSLHTTLQPVNKQEQLPTMHLQIWNLITNLAISGWIQIEFLKCLQVLATIPAMIPIAMIKSAIISSL